MQVVEFIKKVQARAEIFNLLAALFAQPEDEILRKTELMQSLHHWLGLLQTGNNKLARQLELSLNDYSETELLIEYARLFVGPFKTLAPPYSSVYLGDGTVMNDHTVWVLQQYRDAGIDFDFSVHDLPDHIAVENSFLYFLIYNEVKALQENDVNKARNYFNAQQSFFRDHYKIWVPLFSEKGKQSTLNTFYLTLFDIQHKVAGLPALAFPV